MQGFLILVLIIFSLALLVYLFLMFRKFFATRFTAENPAAIIEKRKKYLEAVSALTEQSISFLQKKLKDGNVNEALFILSLLEQSDGETAAPLIVSCISNKNFQVRMESARICRHKQMKSAAEAIVSALESEKNNSVLAEFVKAISVIASETDIEKYLNHENSEVACAAIAPLILKDEFHTQALDKLFELADSDLVADRINTANIIGEIQLPELANTLIILLSDKDNDVQIAAIKSAGSFSSPTILEQLMVLFKRGAHTNYVIDALTVAGKKSIEVIKKYLFTESWSNSKNHLLLYVLGKIDGEEAVALLHRYLIGTEQNENETLYVLCKCDARVEKFNAHYLEMISKNFLLASSIIFKLDGMERNNNSHLLMYKALLSNLEFVKEKLINLFSLVYDKEKMILARVELELNSLKNFKRASEIIHEVIPHEHAAIFNYIFEPAPIQESASKLFKLHPQENETLDFVFSDILKGNTRGYQDWTKACALYSMHETKMKHADLVKDYLRSENFLINETANFVHSEIL